MKHRRIIITLSVAIAIVVSSMIWHVSQLQSELIRSSAIGTAELYAIALSQFRTLYTSEVVERVGSRGVEATHDYQAHENTIPLPATLSMMLGESIGKYASGASSKLYSPYPFPWRRDVAAPEQPEFELRAWKFITSNPDEPYYEFSKLDNKAMLRYATADVMRPDCVGCHNSHPESPKTDWKTGDVRGVLVVNLPLEKINAQTSANLRTTILAYVAVGLGMVLAIGTVIIKLNRQSKELERRVTERTEDLESEIKQRRQAMNALRITEERNRLVLHSAGQGIFGVDLEGKTTFVNPAACLMFGYEESEILGQSMHALIHHSYPDGRAYPKEKSPMYTALASGEERQGTSDVLWRKDGSSFPAEYTSTPMHKDDELVGAVVVVSDITERVKMEERFRIGIEASPAAMIMVEESGNVMHLNREAERVFGYSRGEMVGRSIDLLVPENQSKAHPDHREAFLNKPSARRMGGRDLFARKQNGDNFPVEVGLNPIDTPDGLIILCSIVDLTERKKFEQTILEQTRLLEKTNRRLYTEATVDALTNIGNRRSLHSQLETFLRLARRNGRPVSILMADIDYFKNYNDDFGHPAGDRALKVVAKTLVDESRLADFAARYGGEEFAIVLPETDQKGSLEAGEKIRKAIEMISELDRRITISLGASTVLINSTEPFDAEQIGEKIIKQADQALYLSKNAGRNRVTHFDNMESG